MKRFLIVFILSSIFCSSSIYAIYDPKYPNHPKKRLNLISSNLPIISIDLDEEMAPKSENRRISAAMKIITNQNGDRNYITNTDYDFNGNILFRYRGNSSYLFSDKKPFSVKLQDDEGKNLKVPILGMGADHDWALLAPYSDKSMIRDMLIFDLMRGTFEYTPSGRFCELMINGVYQGVYIMTARVRKGKERINIKSPKEDSDVGLTGGYLLEIDRNDDPGFRSKVGVKDLYENTLNKEVYYQFKSPEEDEMTLAQKNYIVNQVHAMEASVAGENFKDKEMGFRSYIDTLSLFNYFIAQELTKNPDGYRLSTPLYKYPDNIDGRFKFSIWDFNISFGLADYMDGWSPEGWCFNNNRFTSGHDNLIPWIFKRVLQDEVFYDGLKNQWTEYRQGRLSDENIIAKIDSLSWMLDEAQMRNFDIWNILDNYVWPNYYIPYSYEDEVSFLKEWILARVAWIDSQWSMQGGNLVPNGNFEASETRGKGKENEVFMSEWTSSSGVSLSTINRRTGKYAASIRQNASIKQVISELEPGKYDLKIWAKTQQDPGASFYISYHESENRHSKIQVDIDGYKDYHLLEINDFEVSNNFLEIGFNTKNRTGDVRLWVDDISLVKKQVVSSHRVIQMNDDWFKLVANRSSLELDVYINSDIPTNTHLNIYDVYGRKIHNSLIQSPRTTIRNIFVRGQIYIIQIGNDSKKVVF